MWIGYQYTSGVGITVAGDAGGFYTSGVGITIAGDVGGLYNLTIIKGEGNKGFPHMAYHWTLIILEQEFI